MEKVKSSLNTLIEIMNELREKCPWDKKQTMESLREKTIEEVYELSEAIINNDKKNIEEELGDLLLHIVFYAKIGSEKKQFTLNSIINTLIIKLKKRHPHVYGKLIINSIKEVEQNWEKIKDDSNRNLVNDNKDIPKYLPSLSLALKLQKKMPPKDINQSYNLIDKLLSNKHKLNSESIGKLLFEIVNVARIQDIDPEKSLRKHNNHINKN